MICSLLEYGNVLINLILIAYAVVNKIHTDVLKYFEIYIKFK